MVVAIIALFVALGGTSYALSSIPDNSVGTRQLKNGAVTSPKLAGGAVGAPQLKNGAVTHAKLATSSVGTGNVIDGSLLKQDFKPGELPKDGLSAVKINGAMTAASQSSATPPSSPVAVVGPWSIGMTCDVDPNLGTGHLVGGVWLKGPGNAEYDLDLVDDDGANQTSAITGGPALSPTAWTQITPGFQPFTVTDATHYERTIGMIVLGDGSSVATVSLNFLMDARNADSANWACALRGSAVPTT